MKYMGKKREEGRGKNYEGLHLKEGLVKCQREMLVILSLTNWTSTGKEPESSSVLKIKEYSYICSSYPSWRMLCGTNSSVMCYLLKLKDSEKASLMASPHLQL